MRSILARQLGPLAALTTLLMPNLAEAHHHQQHEHQRNQKHVETEHHDQAHGAHVHGLAHLDAALDGQRLTIAVRVPGWDLVGFERAPQDDEERSRVDAARAKLADARRLFVFEPPSTCVAVGEGRVTLPMALSETASEAAGLEPTAADHKGPDQANHSHDHGGEDDPDGRHPSDWSASWTFHCADPAKLRAIRVDWFDSFSRTERVAVQWLGPSGQFGRELTPSSRRIEIGSR